MNILTSTKLLRKTFLIFILGFAGTYSAAPAMAASADDLVDQMLREQVLNKSFDASKANQLCGKWSDSKKILIEFAKSGNQEKIDLAHQIVSHRYSAWEKNWTSTVDDMAKAGISKPIEGMAPTGSWKEPLAYQKLSSRPDQIKFIIDGSNADFDATFFGKNPNVTEDFVERAAIKWARTTGSIPSSGPVDYNKVNEVLKNSEITPFPRHPDGKMSDAFKKKFPEIVRESYPGPQGQRALEQNYLLKSKDASIVKYNKAGQLVTDGKQAQIIRNQPAANLIEDINKAKFTRIERMQQLGADYKEKFVEKFTANKLENQKNTAKMLQRMIEGESRIQGIKASHHPFYQKAVGIKEALREGDDVLVKKLLKGQSLDDFLQEAKTEMSRINRTNQARLTGAVDDAAAASGMTKTMRGLMLLGYGVAGTDAYLKAKTGEEGKEVAKAVTAAIVSDLAASTIGSALGGAAATAIGGTTGTVVGVGTGIGVGILAYIAASKSLDWTEERIENLLGGYQTSGAMKAVFLNKNTIEKFLSMKPEEIKSIVDREWDQQYQWSAVYLKGGDAAEQLERKKAIILKAMEAQNRINQSRLREKIVSEIVQDELARLVDRVARGELSAEELAEARERFKGNEQGLWEWAFGSPLDKLLEDRLKNDAKYSHYRILLERLGESPAGKPGLWERLFGEDRQKARDRADAIYKDLLKDQQALEDLLNSFDSQMQIFNENMNDGKDVTEAYELLAGYIPDMEKRLNFLSGLAAEYLKEHNLGYGGQDDLTDFYARKNEVTAMLLRLRKGVEDRKRQFEKIRLLGDRLVGLQRLKKLEQDIQALETQCNTEESAHKSAQEAWRLSQTIEASASQILTEYRSVLDNAGTACADIQELRDGIIESANNATRWAVSARLANQAAAELLQTCPVGKIDVNNVSNAIKGAMLTAKKAAEEFTLANEGSDVFRAIQAGARDGIAQLGATRNKLSNLETQVKAVSNYIDTANSGLEKMKDPGTACTKSNWGKLDVEIISLASSYLWQPGENEKLSELRGRLSNLTPRTLSKTINQDVEKSQKIVDLTKSIVESGKIEELQGSLTKCDQVEPSTDKLLFAMEAMTKIEGSYNWLNDVAAAKANCLTKLEQQGQVASGVDPERIVERVQITGADPCIITELGQACGPFNFEIWYKGGSKADRPLESITPKLNQATGSVKASEQGVTDEFNFNIEWQLDQQGQVAKGKEPERTVEYVQIKGPNPCVITKAGQDCGPFALHIWYKDGHEEDRALKNVKPKPNQALGTVEATEGGKTAKFSFKILWIETPAPMVDPVVSGYIKPPSPSKSTKRSECTEYDPTNPACEPGSGGKATTGPTQTQIAKAKQLGQQIKSQAGTQPDPKQSGQTIPQTYTSPGAPEPQVGGEQQTGEQQPLTQGEEEEPSILKGGFLPQKQQPGQQISKTQQQAPVISPPRGQTQPTTPQGSTAKQAGSTPQPTPVNPVAKPSGKSNCWSMAYDILQAWQPMNSPYASWVTRKIKVCGINDNFKNTVYPKMGAYKAAGCTVEDSVGHVYPKGDYNADKEAEHLKEAFDDAQFWKQQDCSAWTKKK